MEFKKIGTILLGLGIIAGGVYIGTSITKIPAGYVGVQYSSFGGIKDDILNQGWHITSPTTKVTKYSIATESLLMTADSREGSKENESFNVSCKDGEMKVDFEMQYSFKEDRVIDVFNKYRGVKGEEVISNNLRGKIRSTVNEVLSNYSVLEAYLEKKAEVNVELTNRLREVLDEYGVYVESASIPAAQISDQVKQAIENRTVKSQELESAKLEQEKGQIEADTKVKQAQGEANANAIKSNAIDDKILKQQAIEKWDGKLPTVSGNSDTMIDISSLTK